ncbi:TNKS2 [Symbiodinium sp. CCMP2592]|nr:TNKS2 [Symbiodinium sp. CCMP2592]
MAKPSSLWEGDGKTKPYLDEVKPDSKEWKGIEDHLWHLGGSEVQGLEILKIERNENWHLFSQYRSYRNGLDDEGNEKYLFHGSPSATHEIMDEGKGLDTAYASQEFNVYGVGNYFAPDLRLSLSFIRAQPGQAREILLCRVACGRVGERDRVAPQGASRQQWRGALILTQNELAPEGCQSATSRHRKELVVYKQNHAYPAYRITLRYTDDPRDPYESPSLFNELRVLEDIPAALEKILGLPSAKQLKHPKAAFGSWPGCKAKPKPDSNSADLAAVAVFFAAAKAPINEIHIKQRGQLSRRSSTIAGIKFDDLHKQCFFW